MSDIGHLYENMREEDRKHLNENKVNEEGNDAMASRTIDVNVYGPTGMYMDAEKVTINYSVDIVRASWGINDIDITPHGKNK